MINEKLIEQQLQRFFNDKPHSGELLDFYEEVKADLTESASKKLANDSELSEEQAVNLAADQMGDLSPAIALISQTNDSVTELAESMDEQTNDLPELLEINAGFGEIFLSQSVDEEIHIHQKISPTDNSLKMKTIETPDKVSISIPKPSWLKYLTPLRHPKSKLYVEIPDSFTGTTVIDGDSSSIQVNAINVSGELSISLNSGIVKLNQVKANISNIQISSGQLTASQVQANKINVNGNSGTVNIDNSQAIFNVKVNSGVIKAHFISGSGAFATHSGSIKTSWQDVTDDIKLTTQSGTIDSQLPMLQNFDFKLSAESGTVKLKNRQATYDLRAQGAAMGQTVDAETNASFAITAMAKSGTIKIS
ncbi:DUF4097 family beta strand repeat-containing protein [Lentilactobacillus sp. SPB1-3]|uniref:DUF4097 family beta strand repeat-containing protein n=1 Tax=Lentilactobacillus terminaliae TaxID=3003483 RepID=A0ACD5DFY4_9LACO|nr:DUF4097 family beta strand repeat-containing protein [Lentilactobacillus sp. SPB1-3]MCZ0976830.1 DUF4097 family beta strand repeat-containing protein [Lentilactobacillus sp. SPB1-3]